MDFLYDTPVDVEEIEKRINEFIAEGHEIVMQDDPEKPDLRWWTCHIKTSQQREGKRTD